MQLSTHRLSNIFCIPYEPLQKTISIFNALTSDDFCTFFIQSYQLQNIISLIRNVFYRASVLGMNDIYFYVKEKKY